MCVGLLKTRKDNFKTIYKHICANNVEEQSVLVLNLEMLRLICVLAVLLSLSSVLRAEAA